ncbi:MAG: alginate export family protein [Bacteroidaceae bacterium]|nr:alginate export family protein [Bacteroidaceae bacterium]
MKNLRKLWTHALWLGAMLMLPLCLQAQEETEHTFSLTGSLLSRGELRYGGLPLKQSNSEHEREKRSNFITERARLTLDFAQKGLEAKIVAQHSGIWGQSSQGAFNIYEAWAQLKSKNGLFAKIGRQELAYDDERIIGSNDWAMAASSHDVLKLGYEGHHQKFHVMLAYNQNPENVNGGNYYTGGAQPYKTMQTAWYHFDIKDIPLGASLLFMNVGMQGGSENNPVTKSQQLIGGFLSFKPSHWSFEASYYRQMGKYVEKVFNEEEMFTNAIPIKAWMASVKVGYSPSSHYRINAGYDYLSGDENFATPGGGDIGLIRHDKMRGFTTVYGSHHQFYGAMDFFYVSAYRNGFSPGLQNLYVGGTWTPNTALSFDASYHFLATTAHLRNADKPLGHEIDVTASYALTKESKLTLGYSFMGGTKTMEVLKHTSEKHKLHWAWLMVSISPSAFMSKW